MTQRIAIFMAYVLGLASMLPQLIALVIVSLVAWAIAPVAFKILAALIRLF